MFNFGMPPRCSHDILDYKKIDYFITQLFCTKCGEVIGVIEDSEQKPDIYISGIVRPLTEKEKKELS